MRPRSLSVRIPKLVVALCTAALALTIPRHAAADPNGTWVNLTEPSGRSGHAAVWDPVTDCFIVFGGNCEDSYCDDLWSVPAAGGSYWSPISAVGATPSPRVGVAMIVDPLRHRLIMFGGYASAGAGAPGARTNELWTLPLDGAPIWSPLVPAGSGPPARERAAVIYDPIRDRMILFGGSDDSGNGTTGTWALSLSGTPTWSQLPSCPAPQATPQAVYDPLADRMLVLSDRHYLGSNDVWSLPLANPSWSLLPPGANTPMPGRDLASVVFDPDANRLVVYGGFDNTNYSIRSDLWEFPLGASTGWNPLAPAGPGPGGRQGAPGIYDSARHRLIVTMGGADRQAWALPLSPLGSWSTVTTPDPVRPSARWNTNAVYDEPRRQMVIYGGSGAAQGDELWSLALDGPAFTPLAATNPPAWISQPLVALDAIRERFLVFPRLLTGDLWSLDLTANAWNHIIPAQGPTHYWTYAVGTYDPIRDRLVVFGGNDLHCVGEYCTTTYALETWAFNLSGTPSWEQLSVLGTPPPILWGGTAIYDPVRDRVVVFGGYAQTAPGGHNGRTWALSLSGTPAWSVIAEPSSPDLARRDHSAIYDSARDRMVIYGGSPNPYSSPAWALSLSGTPSWQPLASTGTPYMTPYAHAAVYDRLNDQMIVFDGYNGAPLRTTWALVWGEPSTAVDGGPPGPGRSGVTLGARPNPARGPISLFVTTPHTANARVELFDVMGRLISSRVLESLPAGTHEISFDADGIPPGLLLARLTALGEVRLTRLLLLR